MGKSLLTLDTLEPDRDFIQINEAQYFLRAEGELSLTQIARIGRLSKQMSSAMTEGNGDVESAEKVEANVNEILRLIVVDFPGTVIDQLNFGQKFQIVQVFTEAANRRRTAATTVGPAESQPITVN